MNDDVHTPASPTGRHRQIPGNHAWTPTISEASAVSHHHSTSQQLTFEAHPIWPTAELDAMSAVPEYELAHPPFPHSRNRQPSVSGRTKITLTPQASRLKERPHRSRQLTSAGLEAFELGSVPASVTPPKTWRRAVLFATASSGGVVVALLFAASLLVSKPDQNQAGINWTKLQGVQPTLDGEDLDGTPISSTTPTASAIPTGSNIASNVPTRDASPQHKTSDTTKAQHQRHQDSTHRSPASKNKSKHVTTVKVPVKPPPTQAPFVAEETRYLQLPAHPPATLAAQSQKYFDVVTEDSAAAHQLTSGNLYSQGTTGLEKQHAEVAYYEVKHIEVRQYDGEGVTICTVKTVRNDNSSMTEDHTLTFSNDAKIASDTK